MNALDTDELIELGQSVRSACERLVTEDRLRTVAFDTKGSDRGVDREFWRVLCQQVGVTAIALPDSVGGAGYGVSALGAVAHELGRVLAPVPFLASAVLATELLLGAEDIAQTADIITELVDGQRTAAAIVTRDGGLWQRSAVAVTATPGGEHWNLTGEARHVLNGSAADTLVVVATVHGESAVFLLDTASEGVSVTPEDVLDWTRPMATLRFTQAQARPVTVDGPADELITRSVQRAIAVLSAEQLGANERLLEIASEYACTRMQFGRSIGSFQAVKHMCADMLVDLEWSRSASQAALESIDADSGEIGWRASMAKAVCSESLRSAAHINLQIHGGIGFTWEDAAHLYLKRARTDEVILGGPAQHWDRLAAEAKLL